MTTVQDERVITLDAITIPASETPSVVEVINQGVPTQVANPSRASWRTFVQSLVSFLAVLNTAAALALPFVMDPANGLEERLGPVYGYVVLGLNVIVFVGSTVAKLVAIFMANPRINAWIAEHLPFLAPIAPK